MTELSWGGIVRFGQKPRLAILVSPRLLVVSETEVSADWVRSRMPSGEASKRCVDIWRHGVLGRFETYNLIGGTARLTSTYTEALFGADFDGAKAWTAPRCEVRD